MLRRLLAPVLKCLQLGQAVEGVVDLDGVEMLGVVLEPAFFG